MIPPAFLPPAAPQPDCGECSFTVVVVGAARGWISALPLPAKWIGAAALVVLHGVAFGDAYRIPYQGAAAAGQAEAFSAQADDPSAVFYNAAGMTQLKGWQAYVGTNLVGGDVSFTSPVGQQVQGDLGGSVAVPPPSNLYLTANLKDLGLDSLGPLSIGLGISGSYGLIVRYPRNGPFASLVTSVKLPLMAIKPTIAYQLHETVSLGLGVDIYTFAAFLGEGHFALKNVLPGIGGTELNGSGTAVAYNGSLMVTPLRNAAGQPTLNFGFVYRSQTTLPLGGQFRVNGARMANAETALELPQVVTGAVAYWPLRNRQHEWKLEYDMDFVGWDAFQMFDVRLSNGLSQRTPEHWHSIYSVSAGSEFKWLSPEFAPDWDIALRTGYQRSNSPIPDITFSPVIADADWNIFAVGVGLTCKDQGSLFGLFACGRADVDAPGPTAVGIDFAFQAAFFEPRTIVDNVQPTVVGRYNTTLYIGSVNFRLAF